MIRSRRVHTLIASCVCVTNSRPHPTPAALVDLGNASRSATPPPTLTLSPHDRMSSKCAAPLQWPPLICWGRRRKKSTAKMDTKKWLQTVGDIPLLNPLFQLLSHSRSLTFAPFFRQTRLQPS
eukprot:GHVO01039342.1.p1 GENE.GHVO01039342.1~~GHVO01039342.1.p1  ORF type:complete len:123 (-),score=12.64 GHVO01039342.1:219-587(-)